MTDIGHPASKYKVTAMFVNGKTQTFYCEDLATKDKDDVREHVWLKINREGEEYRRILISNANVLYVDVRKQTEEEKDQANEIYRGVEVD